MKTKSSATRTQRRPAKKTNAENEPELETNAENGEDSVIPGEAEIDDDGENESEAEVGNDGDTGEGEEVDPVELSLEEGLAVSDETLAAVRALWLGGQQLAAVREYRAALNPQPELSVALDAVRQIVETAPVGLEDGESSRDAEPNESSEEGAEVIRLFEDAKVAMPRPPMPRRSLATAPPVVARTGREIIGRTTGETSVELTEAEFAQRAGRLAQMEVEIDDEKNEQANERRKMKERMGQLEAERARLAGIVRDRREVRDVTVILEADFGLGIVLETVEDTGVVVKERAITDAERQLALFPPRFSPRRETKVEEEEEEGPDGQDDGTTL